MKTASIGVVVEHVEEAQMADDEEEVESGGHEGGLSFHSARIAGGGPGAP
jgi:hypothetical protein